MNSLLKAGWLATHMALVSGSAGSAQFITRARSARLPVAVADGLDLWQCDIFFHQINRVAGA